MLGRSRIATLSLALACQGSEPSPPPPVRPPGQGSDPSPPGAGQGSEPSPPRADQGSEPSPPRAGQGSEPSPPGADQGSEPSPPARRRVDPGDLVDIADIAPTIDVDLRYATAENFTRTVLYRDARCLLRRAVAERLARAAEAVARLDYRLRVWDCYRPFEVQEELWRRVPDERYVARPQREGGVPVAGSRHNRGVAVDVTLIHATGAAVEMPTAHDDFSAAASRDQARLTHPVTFGVLDAAMSDAGFVGMPSEWWHYDAPDWLDFPLAEAASDDMPHAPPATMPPSR